MIDFIAHDGGRMDAGYKGRRARDCVVRAITLALHEGNPSGEDYKAVYRAVALRQQAIGGKRTARDGVNKKACTAALKQLGFTRIGLMAKANGGKWLTYTQAWERFRRNMVVVTRGHLAAIVDGSLMDTFDDRVYDWETDWGVVETRERKTATVWLAPTKGGKK